MNCQHDTNAVDYAENNLQRNWVLSVTLFHSKTLMLHKQISVFCNNNAKRERENLMGEREQRVRGR